MTKKLSGLIQRFYLCLGLLVFIPLLISAQHTIHGVLIDESSNQPVEGALIRIPDSFDQTLSDRAGRFSLATSKSSGITLYISHISFEKDTIQSTDTQMTIRLRPVTYVNQEITVSATRADNSSPITYTNISKTDLDKVNLGQDLPYLLNSTPSLVVTSDAGTGIGYTGLRIRGSDATRINVTINGIPVNDAESHQLYWVDLPDLASATENIQIQRGVGTSTNGAGAFGGSVNIQTLSLSQQPYASLRSSVGSFNSYKNTIGFGSGVVSDHFAIDGNMSIIGSDGYIDRATTKLKSFFLSGGYYGKKSSLKAVIMSGKENTYQAWYGVPEENLKSNRTFNPAGMYLNQGGDTAFYDNQTDNYQQDNYQLHYTQQINKAWNFNLSLHGTLGKGYYEEYSAGDDFSKYSLPIVIINADTVTNSDFIRQRWLDNTFYGIIGSGNYENEKIKITIGAGANIYEGLHFGELLWSKDQALVSLPLKYYTNEAQKKELNVYGKITGKIFDNLDAFTDIQLRKIDYSFEGRLSNGDIAAQSASYSFLNPKLGLVYSPKSNQRIYVSAGIAQKEPVRDDFINSTSLSRPKPEKLIDYEGGYQLYSAKVRFGLNIYYMNYKDQLILTGKINDVGEYTRQNVPKSYRSGIELEIAYTITSKLLFEGNISLSKNKIKNFDEYIDDYDTEIQVLRTYGTVNIAYSPAVVSMARLSWNPVRSLNVDLTGKYVGKQYLDNTESMSRSLNAYLTTDLGLRYTIQLKSLREFGLNIRVNNLMNTEYSSNGYTYSYIYGGEMSTFNYFYPQAGRNFMAGINLLF